MTPDTLITIAVSVIVSGLTSGLIVVYMLGQYKQKVDRCEKDLDKRDDDTKELRDRISRLEGSSSRDQAAIDKYIQRKSPLSLTDAGSLTLFESGGKDYTDTNLSELIEAIRAENPKTAYDVQELSKKVISDKSGEDGFIPLKDYIFKKGIGIDILTNIMAIYLRDKSLQELGLEIDDIDKTDPQKTVS